MSEEKPKKLKPYWNDDMKEKVKHDLVLSEEEPKQCDFCDRECLLLDHMSGLNNLCCICREFEEWKYCKKCKKEKEKK